MIMICALIFCPRGCDMGVVIKCNLDQDPVGLLLRRCVAFPPFPTCMDQGYSQVDVLELYSFVWHQFFYLWLPAYLAHTLCQTCHVAVVSGSLAILGRWLPLKF